MSRFAAIDVGTNAVKLLVAERLPRPGSGADWRLVHERSEVTRLGRGVDRTGELSAEGARDTVRAITAMAQEARELKAEQLVAVGTSAARDAKNGGDFLQAVVQSAGVEFEILSGLQEAELCFRAVWNDFGHNPPRPLVAIDVGGGSTELIYGNLDGSLAYRQSFNIGSVRLTERFIKAHPIASDEARALRSEVARTFAPLPPPPAGTEVICVGGTPTTICAAMERMEKYDPERIHRARLETTAIGALAGELAALPVEQRIRDYKIHPGRADVLCAGAWVLWGALDRLGAQSGMVSERGVRWGLLDQRFGDL